VLAGDALYFETKSRSQGGKTIPALKKIPARLKNTVSSFRKYLPLRKHLITASFSKPTSSVQFIPIYLVFWFLVCYTATQLATQLRQRCMQVVRSNKEALKRLAEFNGTPAMDFERAEMRKRKHTQTKNRTKHTTTLVS